MRERMNEGSGDSPSGVPSVLSSEV
jgi:hypothetical protein